MHCRAGVLNSCRKMWLTTGLSISAIIMVFFASSTSCPTGEHDSSDEGAQQFLNGELRYHRKDQRWSVAKRQLQYFSKSTQRKSSNTGILPNCVDNESLNSAAKDKVRSPKYHLIHVLWSAPGSISQSYLVESSSVARAERQKTLHSISRTRKTYQDRYWFERQSDDELGL